MPARMATCHWNFLANGRPPSYLRPLSTTTSAPSIGTNVVGTEGIGKPSYRPHSLLSIKSAKFNLQPITDALLLGLSDTTAWTGPSISLTDSYYVEGINANLKPKYHNAALPELASILHAIDTANAADAWTQFQRVYTEDLQYIQNLSRQQWFQLFNLVSESTHNSQENWARCELVFNSMVQAGHELNPKEISKLIKVASRAGLENVVQEIWNGIYRGNIPRSVELWNSYMKATCNADETLWYRKFNGAKSKKLPLEPRATNDALNLVSDILADGISPDSTTYETVVLYLGQKGDLDYAAAVVSAVWGIKLEHAPLDDDRSTPVPIGSPLYPQISTLVSIINAYGANDQLVEGLKLMEKMQGLYNLPISGDYAILLWETILKWAYFSTEPWGNTPGIALDAIWTSVVDRHHLNPNGKMFHYKIKRDLALRDYDAMLEFIPQVLSSHNVKRKHSHASQILYQATKGLANVGRLEDCDKALEKWAPLGPQFAHVKEKVQRYIATSSSVGKLSPTLLTIDQLGRSLVSYQKSQQVKEVLDNWQPQNSEKSNRSSVDTAFGMALA